jgi:TraM recognition site of TraD and TraG
VLAEQAALQRPQGGKLVVLVLDEFHNFVEANPESLNTFLSQTRKRNVFGCFAHQDWYQTPPALQGALQNCGIRVAFQMDYSDAVITSRILGRVDPLTLHQKVEEGSESFGMPEQWQKLVQELEDLPQRYALVRKRENRPRFLPEWTEQLIKWPTSRLYRIKTHAVPNPQVDERRFEELEEAYLSLNFRKVYDEGERSGPLQVPVPTTLTAPGLGKATIGRRRRPQPAGSPTTTIFDPRKQAA